MPQIWSARVGCNNQGITDAFLDRGCDEIVVLKFVVEVHPFSPVIVCHSSGMTAISVLWAPQATRSGSSVEQS
jgi:hypothetical protein